ncbi:MAG: tRNA (adenosine(37)-N6)-threonylcarbamoyltransferase complex ATPase subunit type 1 TsaE [Gammaproteobacteria bacterium]|nr:tRNA (adenosine(37)-N6)-threonylcarbamoyltransferase complex ATPase subunit type 1 TsaE [Gammaproteobacteria bacterium]
MRLELPDEAETLRWGASFADSLEQELVFLRGELGAGKTTLVRGILRGLGHQGAVKSPTYTLLEPYEFGDRSIYHFDFYRIEDPEELSFIGIDELLSDAALKLVEWPERAGGRLPVPDLELVLTIAGEGRLLELVDRR